MALVEIALPFLAALFAYLSWKRSAMANPYELEDALRNRMKDSVNTTNYYNYQLSRIQVGEFGGWGYDIWKHLPYIGGIRGQSVVYLYFSSPDGQKPTILPPLKKIRDHPKFDSLSIVNISWGDELPHMPEGDKSLEIVFDTIDPDEMLKSITELSGIMIEVNSDSE